MHLLPGFHIFTNKARKFSHIGLNSACPLAKARLLYTSKIKQDCVLFKKIFPTVRWRRTHRAGEEGLWVELGLPSAGRALTFVLAAVVAVAVRRAEVPRRPLGHRLRTRTVLHPEPLTTAERQAALKCHGLINDKYIIKWNIYYNLFKPQLFKYSISNHIIIKNNRTFLIKIFNSIHTSNK